jgi:hypothetical protein
MSEDPELTPVEEKVYEMIGNSEVMCKQIPQKLSGAIPALVQKGLVEVFKQRTSPYTEKKAKYVRRK